MENINVSIRVKPNSNSNFNNNNELSLKETPNENNNLMWKVESNSIINLKSKDIFIYDNVFNYNTTNNDIFNNSIKECLDSYLKGINISIFAYGQTSTGKTYTMRGEEKNPGIIPQSINYIFYNISNNNSNLAVEQIKVSYLEIYKMSRIIHF